MLACQLLIFVRSVSTIVFRSDIIDTSRKRNEKCNRIGRGCEIKRRRAIGEHFLAVSGFISRRRFVPLSHPPPPAFESPRGERSSHLRTDRWRVIFSPGITPSIRQLNRVHLRVLPTETSSFSGLSSCMEPEKRENEISSLERRAFSNPIRFYLFSPVSQLDFCYHSVITYVHLSDLKLSFKVIGICN